MTDHRSNRWLRLVRHRWLDETDVRRALGPDALQRIEQRVQASEAGHSGEIRVAIEAGLPLSYLHRRLSARERALTLFGKLRVWDTEHNNGVLIYLLLAEHAIEIVADRDLARRVPAPQWQALLDGMRDAFRTGRFEDGLNQAIDGVDKLLLEHFPLPSGSSSRNELSNRPWVR